MRRRYVAAYHVIITITPTENLLENLAATRGLNLEECDRVGTEKPDPIPRT